MKDFNEIRSRLFLTNPDAATAEAFDIAKKSGQLMKDGSCPVLDASGSPLIVGNTYFYKKDSTKRVKILCWGFGFKHKLESYYRVFYTDDYSVDGHFVVNVRPPDGFFAFGAGIYPSELVLASE